MTLHRILRNQSLQAKSGGELRSAQTSPLPADEWWTSNRSRMKRDPPLVRSERKIDSKSMARWMRHSAMESIAAAPHEQGTTNEEHAHWCVSLPCDSRNGKCLPAALAEAEESQSGQGQSEQGEGAGFGHGGQSDGSDTYTPVVNKPR